MKSKKRQRRGDEFISVNKSERVWRGGGRIWETWRWERRAEQRSGEERSGVVGERELQMRKKKQTRSFEQNVTAPFLLPYQPRALVQFQCSALFSWDSKSAFLSGCVCVFVCVCVCLCVCVHDHDLCFCSLNQFLLTKPSTPTVDFPNQSLFFVPRSDFFFSFFLATR